MNLWWRGVNEQKEWKIEKKTSNCLGCWTLPTRIKHNVNEERHWAGTENVMSVCVCVVESPLVCSRKSKWPWIWNITHVAIPPLVCSEFCVQNWHVPGASTLSNHYSTHLFLFILTSTVFITSINNLTHHRLLSCLVWCTPLPLDPRKSYLVTSLFCIHHTCKYIKSLGRTCWSPAL